MYCDLSLMIHPCLSSVCSTLLELSASKLPEGSHKEEEDVEKDPEEISPPIHRSLNTEQSRDYRVLGVVPPPFDQLLLIMIYIIIPEAEW